jgi:hypothetical protein
MSELYRLYKVENISKWTKYVSMFDLKKFYDIEKVLPDHALIEYNNDVASADLELKEKDKSLNYIEKFKSNQLIFKSLEKAKINLISYRVFKELEKNETILSNLISFKPTKGFCEKAIYKQTATITGRLTDYTGSPKILTLPARCRKIFESRWQRDGELLYVDFKNLEPRVIRKINGKSASKDIYEEISDSLEFEVDRVIIKRGIISTLYGASSQINGLSKDRSEAVLKATKNYFDLNSILEKASMVNDIGCRNNYFGRPIWNIEETKENKLINNYVQSTAVDIALAYFSELCEKINLELCKPIFIIHDALILDVHNDYINDIMNILSKGYNCEKLGHFPVEIEKLSETF